MHFPAFSLTISNLFLATLGASSNLPEIIYVQQKSCSIKETLLVTIVVQQNFEKKKAK